MTTWPAPMCLSCIHFDRTPRDQWGLFCAAFPDGKGIPEDILHSAFDHREPRAGDHGIQFEQDPGKSKPLRFPDNNKAATS